MAVDLERLVVSLEASLNKYNRQMATAGPTADRELRKAADAGSRNLKVLEDRSSKAAANINRSLASVGRGSGGGLQNFSFQLQDVIVQVQGGTDIMRSLSQQLPQMLGGFGAMGAAAGVAVGLLGGLVTQLDLFGSEAVATASEVKALNDEMDQTKGIATAAGEGYEALTKKLNESTEAARRAFIASLEQQGREEEESIRKTARTAADAMDGVASAVADRVSNLFGPATEGASAFGRELNDLNAAIARGTATPEQYERFAQIMREGGVASDEATEKARALQDEIRSLSATIESGSANPEQYLRLADILRQLAAGAVPELSQKLIAQANEFERLGSSTQQHGKNIDLLKAKIAAANGDQSAMTRITIDNGAAMDGATSKAASYAGAIDNLGQSFSKLRQAQAFQKSGGLIQFDPKMGEGPTIPDRPGVLGSAFSGVKPADLATDARAQDLLDALAGQFGSSGKVKTTKPKVPKKTAAEKVDEKADSRLDALQREIELNTKLLAAYALGDEAMAKIKAQYDAINSARQIGLKEGTAEYADYIAKAQAAEAENAALEAKLKLMGQGKSLTAEMRTEQEALNAKLAEYKALLDAGAITQTTYERAVAKAKDQNAGYAEGIQAIGDAIEGGIQGATSFNDALLKIGLSLAKLVLQAALFGGTAGGGPLGGIFSSLTGLAGGLLGGFGGSSGGPNVSGLVPSQSTLPRLAAGGMGGPGPVLVGESGPEVLSLSQRGHVTPANATRRLMSGGSGNSGPVQIVVSGARGNAEIQQMVAAGVAQGVKISRSTVGKDYDNFRIRYGS